MEKHVALLITGVNCSRLPGRREVRPFAFDIRDTHEEKKREAGKKFAFIGIAPATNTCSGSFSCTSPSTNSMQSVGQTNSLGKRQECSELCYPHVRGIQVQSDPVGRALGLD